MSLDTLCSGRTNKKTNSKRVSVISLSLSLPLINSNRTHDCSPPATTLLHKQLVTEIPRTRNQRDLCQPQTRNPKHTRISPLPLLPFSSQKSVRREKDSRRINQVQQELFLPFVVDHRDRLSWSNEQIQQEVSSSSPFDPSFHRLTFDGDSSISLDFELYHHQPNPASATHQHKDTASKKTDLVQN